MPIFEYLCRGCGHRFEKIVRGGDAPDCPECRGRELEKQLSVFAVSVGGRAGARAAREAAPPACGTCGDPRGPGSCSTN
jgi:putative FmdB family regulatory protein